MCSEIALQVERLGKVYPIYRHPRDRLLQAFWGRRRQLYRPFWALHDVSFQLRRGQALGVLGRNGSGKSTLLQLICGTLTPSKGRVSVQGRIGALLELGSGFNPEFSGRENIYLNATLLGLTRREIDARLDAILSFADVGDFVDQPVKTYSSGMAVRLAFAVQAHVQPDLLIVDEALAVGDEMFQKKCYNHLEILRRQGAAILLVSHSCQQILQHCDRALLLHRGRLQLMGAPKLVTGVYQRLINAPSEQWDALLNSVRPEDAPADGSADARPPIVSDPIPVAQQVPGRDPRLVPRSSLSYEEKGIRIASVEVLNAAGDPANLIPMGQPFGLRFHYAADQSLHDLRLGCNIANQAGVRITGQAHAGPDCSPGDRFSLVFHFRAGLLPGLYFVSGGIWQADHPSLFLHRVVDSCALRITADQPPTAFGLCDLSAGPPTLKRPSH